MKIVQDNERMEKEISTLRNEKETLRRILDNHILSGNCRNLKHELDLVTSSPVMSSSVTSSSMTSSSSSPLAASAMTVNNTQVTEDVCEPTSTSSTQQDLNCSFKSQHDLNNDFQQPNSDIFLKPINNEDFTKAALPNQDEYLKGLGPLSPEQTFTDLDDLDDQDIKALLDNEDIQKLIASDPQLNQQLIEDNDCNKVPMSASSCSSSFPSNPNSSSTMSSSRLSLSTSVLPSPIRSSPATRMASTPLRGPSLGSPSCRSLGGSFEDQDGSMNDDPMEHLKVLCFDYTCFLCFLS